MGIKDYIYKVRHKSESERKRLAVIWTSVAFSIILVIWIISFRETNRLEPAQADPAAASLNDLKTDFQDNLQIGKDSIQNMMQEVPASPVPTAPVDNSVTAPNDDNLNTDNSADNQGDNSQDSQDSPNVPQLP
jgi:heme/copper-type cytochrome/quinol oxidase subunit 2